MGARFLRWLRSRRVVVQDRSMLPTLAPGDRLRMDPGAFHRLLPKEGDLVVVRDPGDASRWLVKRVASVRPAAPTPGPTAGVWLASDNAAEGRDSRHFGEVATSELVGRAYFRYAPKDRRGRL